MQPVATLFGRVRAALDAISADFEPTDDNLKTAVALDLPFQPVEEITLKLDDFATTQAGHVNMVALGTSLVVVLLALHMHQVELVNQPMPLQQIERPIDGHAVNAWVKLARVTENLSGIEVLLRIFDNFENRPPLVGHAQAARRQSGLQASGGFSLRKRHGL